MQNSKQLEHLRGFLAEVSDDVARVEGPIEYQGTDGPFVVIFTHDWSNLIARKAEATLVARSAERSLIRVFGAPGAFGREMMEGFQPFRNFPHQDTIFSVAEHMLRTGQIGTFVFLGLVSPARLSIIGLEDKQNYAEVARLFREQDWSRFEQANSHRFPILVDNLLAALGEEGESIAAVGLSLPEYIPFKNVLIQRSISHAVVRSLNRGDNQICRMDPYNHRRDEPTMMDPLQHMFTKDEAAERAAKP
jgi:hypothetical protein